MCHSEVAKKITTRILCSILFSKNSAVYELVLKNTTEPDTPQTTIQCMRYACWITEARHVLKMCDTHCFYTATIVMRMCLNITLYVRCLLCISHVHSMILSELSAAPSWFAWTKGVL